MEEGDTARFVVTLSPASDQTLTVRYRTEDGTADEGTDYRAVSRTLTFVPGDTEQTILVWTHEDDVDDPNETFTAELSNPIGATLEDGSATGTIIEYDESVPLPKLSIVDTTVVEGGTAQFTVRLSPASEQTVTVSYRTASGTASRAGTSTPHRARSPSRPATDVRASRCRRARTTSTSRTKRSR